MTNTSQFIRRVLRRSCSEELPCEMCRLSPTHSGMSTSPLAVMATPTRGSACGSKRTDTDQRSSTCSSANNSPRLSRRAKRPMTSAQESNMMQKVKSIVPKMTTSMRKGQCGTIAVFGGCIMYTGAPYFAAISALKTGSDLVHVFCEKESGPIIKTYSPELIVHPVLDQEYGMEEIDSWLPRLHCIVMGPGLGRNQSMLGRISLILEKVKAANLPIVIDADGLWHLTTNPTILKGYTKAVITPNAVEFSRLVRVMLHREVIPSMCPDQKTVEDLAEALGHLTVLHKGAHDVISNGHHTEECHAGGCPRRCGGQGDLLAGCLATFLHWAYNAATPHSALLCDPPGLGVVAAWGACRLSRACAAQAFCQHGRSLTTSNLVDQIHSEFSRLYESETFL